MRLNCFRQCVQWQMTDFFLFQSRLMVPTFTIFEHKRKPVRFSYISENKPLGLLQGFVVFLQHNPSLGSHEAIGGIGPLPRHLSHTCARDEIVILVAGKKEKRGSESQRISNQWKDAYQQHRKYKQWQPAALESVTDSWRSSSDSFQQKHSKVLNHTALLQQTKHIQLLIDRVPLLNARSLLECINIYKSVGLLCQSVFYERWLCVVFCH